MLRQLFLRILFFGLTFVTIHAAHKERVLLRDVQVITLNHGKWTTGRRTRPVQQLTCIGGTNRCKHLPATVQCYNRGTDGQDIQWECKAVMDKNLRFNKIEVTCEGYDYPEDDYVLVGSCGLEYSIDTVDGKTPFPEPHFNKPDSRNIPHKFRRNDEPGVGTLIILFLIASVMYAIYSSCVKPHRPQNRSPPPAGFRPEFSPPPGPAPSAPPADGDGPGFWSGLGLGGLAGYFAGSQSAGPDLRSEANDNDRSSSRTSYGRDYRNRSGGSSGWFSSTTRRRSTPPSPPPSPSPQSSE